MVEWLNSNPEILGSNLGLLDTPWLSPLALAWTLALTRTLALPPCPGVSNPTQKMTQAQL